MSQKYLKDTSVVPRTGFVYRDEDTKAVITGGSFGNLIKSVVKHRQINGLESDATLVDKVHGYLCANNPDGFCSEGVRGLGDLVHFFAQPVAGVIDSVLGTKIKGCGACARRREALNRAVPFRH